MQGFTILDAVVAGVVVLSAILAYSRGAVREVMAIGGWVIAGVVAFILAPPAEPIVREAIRRVPPLDGIVGESCELGIVIAFAVVFALSLLVVSLFTPLLSSAIHASPLGVLDRALGFVFGVARGVVLVAVALVAYDRAISGEGVEMVDASRSVVAFEDLRRGIEAQIPSDAPGWMMSRYEGLVGACDA